MKRKQSSKESLKPTEDKSLTCEFETASINVIATIQENDLTSSVNSAEVAESNEMAPHEDETILQNINEEGTANHNMKGRRLIYSLYSLKNSTNNSNLILSILKPHSGLQNVGAIKHGTATEGQAKREYTHKTGNNIIECGLFIYLQNGILAASPDGLIGTDGLIEIKCPESMVGNDPSSMPKILGRKSYLIEDAKTKTIHLKKTHAYYKQIIMQLYVADKQWCHFVVYSYKEKNNQTVPFDPFIEKIERNSETDNLWKSMVSKFSQFYEEDLAPEIVNPRHKRSMPIRQPKYRLSIEKSQPIQRKQTV